MSKSKKFNTIVFRNYFNAGDLHCIRTFIWYIKNKIHGYEYRLNHPQSIKTLGDLGIPLYWTSKQIPKTFDNRGYHIEYNTLFINTQYLAYNGTHFNKHSATLLTAWNIFNQTLNEVFELELSKDYKQFLPKINYKCGMYNTNPIDAIDTLCRKVLICNNEFGSEQAIRFDFDPIILELSRTFPDIMFYISNKSNVVGDNIIYVSGLLGDCNGNDLNEISYLSTKCDVLIGRNSGPHTFSYVSENMLNRDKKFISFSAPSRLYGDDPNYWTAFGIKDYAEEGQHAQFFNIPKIDDRERISEICKIIGG